MTRVLSPLSLILLLALMAGSILQSAAITIAAEPDTDAGRVHHFDYQADTWEPQLPAGASDRDLQLVIGTDERTQVSPTNVSPYQSIAYMEAWDDDQEMGFSCTASFVGPRVLLTAAHCLWIDEFGGWPDRVIVAAGKDGESNPFGYQLASSVWVPGGWADTTGNSLQRFRWDFGLIILPDSTMGDTVGALEIGVLSDQTLLRDDFNPTTSGYPGDKPGGTQWTSTQPAFDRITATHLVNSIDAFQGQSGSGIWGADDGRIVGVVSFETRTTNYAVRMSEEVLNTLTFGCNLLPGCEFNHSIEGVEPEPTDTPQPGETETPEPEPSPSPPPAETPEPEPTQPPAPDTSSFDRTWERTDLPVANGTVNRTWIWGPQGDTTTVVEPYLDSPGGERTVTYYDKSRMEITNPNGDPSSIWYVTNGLLVVEMITGNLQVGNTTFEQHDPARINVAGDPDDDRGPTYATFAEVLDEPALDEGAAIVQRINRDGSVATDPSLEGRGITAASYVEATDHTVASVFWEFMNEQGVVYQDNGFTIGPLFQNPYYATGLPISEAYWTTVRVNGTDQDILIQAFERRVLTYTPSNPAGWQVEAGNVGQHYYQWRYE